MEFDYIIVGAGSAGSVLADALSADGRSTVLLLEAGGANRTPYTSMPRGFKKLWMNPDYFWIFPIEPGRGRPADEKWLYGKGLGGSSSVNGMWYFRGQPKDYDSWEQAGNKGWNWREIERCYKRLEDYDYPDADPSRGKDGPVAVTKVNQRSPLFDAAINAGAAMGLPRLADVNKPATEGIGYTQVTVDRRGRRVSGNSAFLQPARSRPNLTIRTNTCAKRIVFEGKRACGIVCDDHGKEINFKARREVIISAGVLQSPKLLQLSGIGPADLLARHRVPLVHELPPQHGRASDDGADIPVEADRGAQSRVQRLAIMAQRRNLLCDGQRPDGLFDARGQRHGGVKRRSRLARRANRHVAILDQDVP